ncbi:type III polyketide synthase [Pseudalkalibacillus berkeleyi]|uniref:Type III polyketide synthase n=1 Tax=Pseudalkalibacillus berkeleyi TaxID=1069813 RepID=A0ABS9GY26_9BACL|nr:3-oxoacyl-[acyl-carrier-protein] synthase III C-terminal domain-containing protein [Pseudalkalibacillus berkeleyi]MCF6137629.1 type III polyketide synthase [Pseudalkalibacillus berkeleyi]
MPYILSVGTCNAEHKVSQTETVSFAYEMFKDHFSNIDRLLKVFDNGQVQSRYFVKDVDWYKEPHSLKVKNDLYINKSIEYSIKAIENCLDSIGVPYHEIDAIIFVSSTGFSTPSIEARIMNKMPFSSNTKRIPIWGLGCAGGASGLSRAHDYCKAYPDSKVLLVCVELCSLTFQHDDYSKSNLIGTSLFADGVAAVLVIGEDVKQNEFKYDETTYVRTVATQSTLKPDSEEVMGWDVKDNGLNVVFSKDIPTIVDQWMNPTIHQFLIDQKLEMEQIKHLVAHPGGIKVLEAYKSALSIDDEKIEDALYILKRYGNMSSVTVLYVLQRFLQKDINVGDLGLLMALGPGFSSEILLLEWTN